MVDLTGVEQGKEIKSYTVSYNGYGCGNTPNGWCTAGGDDTITTNITFTDGTNTEISSHVVAVPYEDGWTHHSFTKSINDTFLTGDVTINFELSGVDTGDSTSWLGPITDNYEFAITYEPYVVPVVVEPIVVEPIVVEPIVVEPIVVEPIVVIEPEIIKQEEIIKPMEVIKPEENMVGGIDLSTEVTLDLIQDVQMMPEIQGIELTPEVNNMDMNMDINMNMTNIEIPTDVDLQNQPVEIETTQQIESVVEIKVEPSIVVNIPDIADLSLPSEVEEIQEIKEIQVPETANVSIEPEIEQPEELKDIDMEKDMAEIKDELEDLSENKENNNEQSEETASNDGNNEKSELSESDVQESNSKKVNESKVVKKDKPKDDKKSKKNDSKKTTVKKQSPKTKNKTMVQKPKNEGGTGSISVGSLGSMVLPSAYLQVLQDTIKIVETVSITQDMLYEQNTYDLVQSTFESSFGGDSPDRFDSLLGVQSRYQSPTYRNSGK